MFEVKRIANTVVHRNSPKFIIIGAQKSGTSSLHFYLNQHKGLSGSNPKEIHYFDREINHGKTHDWYESHFYSWFKSNKLFFESTPSYLYYPNVAKSIHEKYPDIKLIAILRNPVERAFSAWNMYRDFFDSKNISVFKSRLNPDEENPFYTYLVKGRDSFPALSEVMSLEMELMDSNVLEPALLRRGLYYDQLVEYYKFFDREDILILGFRDLIDDLKTVLERISDFLEIQHFDYSSLDKEAKNRRPYVVEMDESERILLEDFYSESNLKLNKLLGYELNW